MKYSAIIIFFTLLVILSSCKKDRGNSPCNDTKLGTFKFSDSELKIIPYNIGDQIVFKSSVFDSIIYDFDEEFGGISIDKEFSTYASECKGRYYEHEYKCLIFKNKYMDNLIFFISFSNPFMDTIITKRISIQIKNDIPSNGCFHGSYCFQTDTIFNHHDTIYQRLGTVKKFHNSIELGPKTFLNVYELNGIDQYQIFDNYITELFYSINEGVVGYKLNNGKAYYLFAVNKKNCPLPNMPSAASRAK